MKTLKTSLKTTALFFIAMTLLQSCIAYQNTPVSLQQAEQSKKRVKLKTSSNQTYDFEQIVLEEEEFYGLKKEKGEITKTAISDAMDNKLFLQSKRKSTWATLGVIGVPVIALVIIVRSSLSFNSGLSFE